MRVSSCKAKGRRAAQEAKDTMLKATKDWLFEDDIVVTSSSVTGEDLMLSPMARKIFPYCFELKNTEKINIWSAIRQAEAHCLSANRGPEYPDYTPVVVFRKNNQPLRAVVDFHHFVELVSRVAKSSL